MLTINAEMRRSSKHKQNKNLPDTNNFFKTTSMFIRRLNVGYFGGGKEWFKKISQHPRQQIWQTYNEQELPIGSSCCYIIRGIGLLLVKALDTNIAEPEL